jgi:hypothetical protein
MVINDEFSMIWKVVKGNFFKILLQIYVVGLRKTIINVTKDSRCVAMNNHVLITEQSSGTYIKN